MEFRYSNKVKQMKPSIIRELLKQMSRPAADQLCGRQPGGGQLPRGHHPQIQRQSCWPPIPVGMLQYSVTEGYGPLRKAARDYANRQWRW